MGISTILIEVLKEKKRKIIKKKNLRYNDIFQYLGDFYNILYNLILMNEGEILQ